jgi:hypothetical protein
MTSVFTCLPAPHNAVFRTGESSGHAYLLSCSNEHVNSVLKRPLVITLHCLHCNMASERNFLATFQDITTVLNLGLLADYLRTLGIPGRQRDHNTKIKKKDGFTWI